jgi:hypothetical protein
LQSWPSAFSSAGRGVTLSDCRGCGSPRVFVAMESFPAGTRRSRQREFVGQRQAQVAVELAGSVGGRQHCDRHQAAVAGGPPGPLPDVAEQHLIGQLHHLRGEVAEQLLCPRRPLRHVIAAFHRIAGRGQGIGWTNSVLGNRSAEDGQGDAGGLGAAALAGVEAVDRGELLLIAQVNGSRLVQSCDGAPPSRPDDLGNLAFTAAG